MKIKQLATLVSLAAAVAACESGDINLQPTNVDNSTSTGGGGGAINPCASYTVSGETRSGNFDGTNCTYNATFVSETNPITVDLVIPFFSGVHIFQNSLFIGEDVSSGAAPAGGSGPTLVVEAGNTIAFSDSGDYLLINRGSQIMAEGSATAPITLTGFTDAVSGTAGPFDVQLWGGIVINGNGITNNCTDAQRAASSCHVESEGRPSYYGGNDNAESSGVLRYVVVKHTGFEVAPGDELNGITFNAVGSGTVVENVQAYSTYDDGFEFFGGAVNVTNAVAMYVRDDSLDFSDGYVGTISNALVIHAPTDGNRCIEGDNVSDSRIPAGGAAGTASTAPISRPTIRHLTCIPSGFDGGTHGDSEGPIIRFGARLVLEDSIIDSGPAAIKLGRSSNECWEIETATNGDTQAAAAAGDTTMNRTVIACQEPTADNMPNGDTGQQWVLNTGAGNYAFNAGNVIITDPGNASVRVLQPNTYFSFNNNTVTNDGIVGIIDGVGAAVEIRGVADEYIGAVRAPGAADWTANWVYGVSAGNRGIAPWWE
jgi:hypothetical protein